MKYAPIVLFVYNRPWHTKQTIEALQKNELAQDSELIIYSDGAKNDESIDAVEEVREFIHNITGFKKITIIERDKNWGLAESIIDGVTTVINQYGSVIVLEDDLMTAPGFLKYMNDGLLHYQNEKKVASIHGYIYPIEELPSTFFIRGADCWGWATWKRAWDLFEPNGQKLLDELQTLGMEKEADFNGSYQYTQMLKDQIEGKNNSWAIRWYVSAFLQNLLTLYPGKSYINNIGNDDSGTHSEKTDMFLGVMNDSDGSINSNIEIVEDLESRKKIEAFFRSTKKNLIQRFMTKIIGYLN